MREALAQPGALRHEPDPRGILSAREAAAQYLGARAGVSVSADRVFLTASTSEAYAHLFRLLCDPGDEVLAPRPSYPLIEPIARLEDVEAHAYRLAYDGERWRLDLDSLEASITARTRAVVLVEPNNPTGSRLADDEFARVEAICVERGLALISDEVFGDIVWAGAKPFPGRLGGRAAPTFVLGGISKPCGLPQLKLGWIAADGPEEALARLLPRLEWILDLFLSVGSPVQWALPRLLRLRHAYQRELAARLRENLGSIEVASARHGDVLIAYRGEGGLSAILRVTPGGTRSALGEDFAECALRERDVYVHPAHFYDLDRDDLIVVSLLTKPEVLREALQRIVE